MEYNTLPAQNRVYSPPNFANSELQNGGVVPGEWRNEDNEGFWGLAPYNAHHTTRKII